MAEITEHVPFAGEPFYPNLEDRIVLPQKGLRGKLKELAGKATPTYTIKKVFHETNIPAGLARTWCITVEENDTCYDCAWSHRYQHWVYGGANSGLKG